MSTRLSMAERGIVERTARLHATLPTLSLSTREAALEKLCRDTVALQAPPDLRDPNPYLGSLFDRTDRIVYVVGRRCTQDAAFEDLAAELMGRSLALGLLPLFRGEWGAGHLTGTIRDGLKTNQGPPVWGAALCRLLREPHRPRAVAIDIVTELSPFDPYDVMLIRLTEPDLGLRRGALDAILTDSREAIDFTRLLGVNRTDTIYLRAAWTVLFGAAEAYNLVRLRPLDCSDNFVAELIRVRLAEGSEEDYAGLREAVRVSGLVQVWDPVLRKLCKDDDPQVARRAGRLLDELRPV